MNIEVGDRVTYINENGKEYTEIMSCTSIINSMLEYDKENLIQILKVERTKYEEPEEVKVLLTDEEKEFLENYIKLIESLNNGEAKEICRQGGWLTISLTTELNYAVEVGPTYIRLDEGKLYTLEELGLEE